ncbi:phosphatidate cytidylyltransferase [Microbacterium endophyticum]|uniref:Phosphatidate cytidylyltransferase n=1 Tax=Microbacterium endophyticum TaxID=1526412 RepID=A0A7W4V0H2_9MICO|nr:phosphatidate cytidylyltransferase [Microbacterium endophyticum]MBB2974612.1 phosphatidate cytidylyltransferase [Microbacterium endophyticum]NIK36909.1 phosphatidate cytidylyltransferase [Microbacterium endophyticum]
MIDPADYQKRDDELPARSESPHAFGDQVRSARSEFETQVAHARAEFEEANARIRERTGRDLILAIIIGVSIGAIVLASLIFASWPFAVFAAAATVLSIFEFTRALQASGRRIDLIPQVASGVAIVTSGYLLGLWVHWVVVFVAIAFVVVWRLIAQMSAQDSRTYGDVVDDVLYSTFVQMYIPFLASLVLILLRNDSGAWWVLAFLIVVVVSDTGAYVSGLTMGRHPMAPRISPKKTWEGFAGAALAAIVAGVLLAWLLLGLPWWTGIIFGAVILCTATIGDLGESMVKRDLGIKDMSSWLPGHGGVLDRLDSILPSTVPALVLYYLLTPLVAS